MFPERYQEGFSYHHTGIGAQILAPKKNRYMPYFTPICLSQAVSLS